LISFSTLKEFNLNESFSFNSANFLKPSLGLAKFTRVRFFDKVGFYTEKEFKEINFLISKITFGVDPLTLLLSSPNKENFFQDFRVQKYTVYSNGLLLVFFNRRKDVTINLFFAFSNFKLAPHLAPKRASSRNSSGGDNHNRREVTSSGE
jgi:hypothetical protein